MKLIAQHDQMDCGPACLAMIASIYGKEFPLQYLKENAYLTKEGVSLSDISDLAERIGFETYPSQIDLATLKKEGALPCILYWNKNHFVVLHDYKKKLFSKEMQYKIADPSYGLLSINEDNFEKSWLSDNKKGIVLFLSPTDKFYSIDPPKEKKLVYTSLLIKLKTFYRQFIAIFIMLLLGGAITITFPFLTQYLIDKGIDKKDLNIITLILISQLALYLGAITLEIIRNRIMLIVGTKFSISIISDFFKGIFKLPINYFETKMKGDFNQRIKDSQRIEEFLTSQSVLTFFSMITFSVFFGVLWFYNFTILFTYITITFLAITWTFYWLKKRKILNYFKFQLDSENQDSIYEMIDGVSEMKLNQFEDYKRLEWSKIQYKLFNLNIRIMKIDQLQVSGFEFINQIKNILVTFLAAKCVIDGILTLGELLSVSFIIGQMNSPVNQLVVFFRSFQDAKLSLLRLNEMQNHEEEEKKGQLNIYNLPYTLEEKRGVSFKNINFRYGSPKSPLILRNINFEIPEGKITAIVGSSGSGKTTIMKLLLKFCNVSNGQILYNSTDIQLISPKSLRENCGVVMQEGFLFSDTIARNIAMGDEVIDKEKLEKAVSIANIKTFIEALPLKYNTKIGASGNGISGGQKQRILIARAVYKNPHYIFFDEATSALDAENEKIIHDNLQEFFKGKTVVIIAHRLSTVKNADNIIVLKDGKIIEQGNHQELVYNKAGYYNLVKNQLELGN